LLKSHPDVEKVKELLKEKSKYFFLVCKQENKKGAASFETAPNSKKSVAWPVYVLHENQ
jgi:hypothetical protein